MSLEKAYEEGFCKAAEEAGLDKSLLLKVAVSFGWIGKAKNLVKNYPKVMNAGRRAASLVTGADKARLATEADKATKAVNRARKAYTAAKSAPGVTPDKLKALRANTSRLGRQSTKATKALAAETWKVRGMRGALGAAGAGTLFGLGRASASGENGAGGVNGMYPQMFIPAAPDYMENFRVNDAIPRIFQMQDQLPGMSRIHYNMSQQPYGQAFNFKPYIPDWQKNLY